MPHIQKTNKNTEQPFGNYYDKYHSKNIIVKKMMSNFFHAYDQLISSIGLGKCSILEAGCGEGEIANFIYLKNRDAQIDAFDISEEVIETARLRTSTPPPHPNKLFCQ